MFKRFRNLLMALLMLASVTVGASACTSSPQVPPMPATWYVSYQGQNYCPYIYDAHEIDMYGAQYGALACARMIFPSMGAQVVPGTLGFALMDFRLRYALFLDSGYWYDTFYAPMGPRYHVTLIQRNTYLNYAHDFDTRYAPQIKTASAKAKWSNGRTGAYTFPATNVKKKTTTTTNTGGGFTGTDNSSKLSGTGGGNYKPPTRTGTNLGGTGKSGTTGGRRR